MIRPKLLSSTLASCIDIDTGRELLLSPQWCRGVGDTPINLAQFVEACTLKKENRFKLGAYLEATGTECEHDPKSPLHITQVLALETRPHDGWEARQSRHGADTSRFGVFAEFVMQHLGLREGCIILDAAGGKGGTAAELSRLGAAKVILVDPAAHAGASLSPELVAIGKVELIRQPLDQEFVQAHQQMLGQIDAIVGLHPDQATDIVCEIGLEFGKPFAVCPCCVFPQLFPGRKRKAGQGVVTCNGLVAYLREQSDRLQVCSLAFEGANQVVYCPPLDAIKY